MDQLTRKKVAILEDKTRDAIKHISEQGAGVGGYWAGVAEGISMSLVVMGYMSLDVHETFHMQIVDALKSSPIFGAKHE